MSRATTSRRVWLGVKLMYEQIDLSKLSQKDADLVLRAMHWAQAKEHAYETEQLIQRKRKDDRLAALRAERILAQQMGRGSVS